MKYRYNIFSSFRISKGDKIEVMNFYLSKKKTAWSENCPSI